MTKETVGRAAEMTYLPPKIPNPKADLARRKRMISTALWLAAIPPLIFMLMVFGYSDQAPGLLRDATIAIDTALGSPVWGLIGPAPK